MNITTKYNIGDIVYDILTKKYTTIIGISIKKGTFCCSDKENDEVLYYVENHLCNSYRKEEELVEDLWNY